MTLISPVLTPSYYLKFHFYIIFPSTPVFSKVIISQRFQLQKRLYDSNIHHSRYMPLPTHFSHFIS
jgi:hypothetical protein